MFAASLRLTLDYDALIETDSHNDDQQEDKNDYREDDPSVSGHGTALTKGTFIWFWMAD